MKCDWVIGSRAMLLLSLLLATAVAGCAENALLTRVVIGRFFFFLAEDLSRRNVMMKKIRTFDRG